jgi:hypothetical protein
MTGRSGKLAFHILAAAYQLDFQNIGGDLSLCDKLGYSRVFCGLSGNTAVRFVHPHGDFRVYPY